MIDVRICSNDWLSRCCETTSLHNHYCTKQDMPLPLRPWIIHSFKRLVRKRDVLIEFQNISLTMRQTLAGTHWHRVEPPFAFVFSFGQLSVLCWAILLRLFRLNLRTPGDQEMASLKSPICSRLVLSPPIHDKYVSIRHMEVIDDDSRWLTRKLLHAWYSVMVQLSQ